MKDVSIAGIGETTFGKYPERTLHQMISEAGHAAMDDAGITPDQVEAVFVGNFNAQTLSNQGHLGPLVAETLRLGPVPTMRTEGACASGSLALLQGIRAFRAGEHEIVLVGGVEKMTHRSTPDVTSAIASAMDVELEAVHGLTFPGSFAMIANRYFHEYRDVRREMAMVAVQSHENALLNPHAQLRKRIDVQKVLDAPLIADPLGLFDCSLVSDGAAFLVLTTPEIADRLRPERRRVDVVGTGHAGDHLTLPAKQTMTSFVATRNAAANAYAMAGIQASDVQFAEVHDCFTITQVINTEDLGFFEHGKGADAVAEGLTARDGRIPVNASGGLKAKGHPIGATGVGQVVEIVTQIRGEAGERQLDRHDIGLAHNLGGTAATCVVTVLKGA